MGERFKFSRGGGGDRRGVLNRGELGEVGFGSSGGVAGRCGGTGGGLWFRRRP